MEFPEKGEIAEGRWSTLVVRKKEKARRKWECFGKIAERMCAWNVLFCVFFHCAELAQLMI